ncbi:MULTISPECIES: histidine phosphatase family protein [unclassified Planococcus (in: firmicutes)]|uniref:histidine phosphatase family protein n=1 Tax=unclassified Planococcus (in: firmicutes) TaxID=2662419 RepID=UPI000C326602|nr:MULTISPECIES: histidine phosphatase family protein [unclassified Planococcus (in: firmicutes)]AUD14635.1 histidine phosphatase family protein [Planococcus sp. MB-3u-03]PKG44938.1 histidine phosphatase family protein [Planococcus sp. Urea-trap-24]PKG87281.1 histidine phosphatase family protein [Planococcus sp. Urea-3u-39]PKH42406.1 histidine phosphatase family protein [Planococcus sp. MB-3u-09]
MGNAFVLRLIRHAPTAGNVRRAYIGWTDEPILPFESKPDHGTRLVWGSDLLRCRQTAHILFPDAHYEANADLRELHFGDWENMTYDDLQSNELYRNWIDDPKMVQPPNGESLQQLAERVDRAIETFSETGDYTVVTHGGPIRYILSKANRQQFFSQQAAHGHCYTVTWASKSAYKEGHPCVSYSAEPLTAKASM